MMLQKQVMQKGNRMPRKFKVRMVALGFVVLGGSAMAKTVTELPPDEPANIIASEKMLGERLISIQRQYFPVSLPSLTERLLQPAGSFPVDFKGFDPKTRKEFRGWIDENGIVHYAVGLYEDYWTGEIVVLDDSGREMFRIPRKKTYDKYDLQREFFDLGRKDILTDKYARSIFLPGKISTTVDLIPSVFWDTHLQIESQKTTVPEMMAMTSGGGVSMMMSGEIPLPVDVIPQTNGTVELWIDTSGTSVRHIEIFSRKNLVYSPGWVLVLNNLNADSIPVFWSETATNQMFYYVNNADDDFDGDGYSDLRERLDTLTLTNYFDFHDSDSDGLQDWFEIRFWGSIALYDAMDDPDGDGLSSGEEMAYVITPGATNVVFSSDPSLYDSDFEGLNDMEEKVWGTDPMNPDSDFDGLTDAAEVLGFPPTNPNDNDIFPPTVSFLNN